MLRSILVALDASEHGGSALEYGIGLARRFDALLVGLGLIDEPGIHGSEEYLVGEAYFERLNADCLAETRREVEQALGRAALRCAEAGVAFKPLEFVGSPAEELMREAQRFDLVVVGQDTHFEFGSQDRPDSTVGRVVAASPRPVVIVPHPIPQGEDVVVGYDGSLQAARALAAFVATGLGDSRVIHVVAASAEKLEAARHADRAVEFLRSHGLDARPDPLDAPRPPADLLLEAIGRFRAGLVVLGAYGQPAVREFFFGSTTRTMLRHCPAPLFVCH